MQVDSAFPRSFSSASCCHLWGSFLEAMRCILGLLLHCSSAVHIVYRRPSASGVRIQLQPVADAGEAAEAAADGWVGLPAIQLESTGQAAEQCDCLEPAGEELIGQDLVVYEGASQRAANAGTSRTMPRKRCKKARTSDVQLCDGSRRKRCGTSRPLPPLYARSQRWQQSVINARLAALAIASPYSQTSRARSS